MSEILSCRRCSITRVNLLCELHELAYVQKDLHARKTLDQLVSLAGIRGYGHAGGVLDSSLPKKMVRSLCWNISSVLTDKDFEQFGFKVCKDQ